MQIFNTIMNWFSSTSWADIAGVISLWIIAFRALANLTPTTKDDSIVNWIYSIFAVLGVKVPDLEMSKSGIVAK